jgi:hypothetical protein
VGELARFRVVYEDEASEFIIAQAGRRRRKLADRKVLVVPEGIALHRGKKSG